MGEKNTKKLQAEGIIEPALDLSNALLDQEAITEEPEGKIITKEIPKTKAIKPNLQERELINCLRNERIVVKYVMRASDMIKDKKHIAYGGLIENAHITLTVPMLNSGAYTNVLTNDEKDFLESVLNLDANALSIYRKEDNFWENFFIRLGKEDTFLELSNPNDYITYKVLLANKNIVCPSITELKENPKRTYRFYLVSEQEEVQSNLLSMNSTMEANMLLGKIMEDRWSLKYIIEVMTGKGVSRDTKMDFLLSTAFGLMQNDTKLFLALTRDQYLKIKVFIYRCIEHGLIRKRDNLFYLSTNNSPLCKPGEEPTLNNAAKFLNNIGNQDIKFTLEAKVKSKEE